MVASSPPLSAVIVGSGFSGICTAIRLLEAGVRDFVILERADDLGGTWRDNRYPGCACDVPSDLYCYSFEPYAGWSRDYAPQAEILAYLRRCAEKYGVLPYVRYGAEVVSSAFDAASATWTVGTRDGRTFHARAVVLGIGALSNPHVPDLPGLSRFRGPAFHTARWDDTVSLAGRRVAVIGSGASAVQLVPHVAAQAAKLDYYQRTPPWVLPKPDGERTEREKRRYARFPLAQAARRTQIYWTLELGVLGFVVHPALMQGFAWAGKRHIRRTLPDPELRAKVTPTYTPGCKRILLSNDYYPALARENVEVITDGIAEIREQGVVTRDGTERPADVLVLATGFSPQTLVPKGAVTGVDGRDLHDTWAAAGGAEAFLGVTVHGFPNLYLLMGPNTGLGHSSMIFMIEAQVEHVMRALAAQRERGIGALDVRADAQERYNRNVQARLARTVWATGCQSWYLDANGRNTTLWPGFTFSYRRLVRAFDLADYEAVA